MQVLDFVSCRAHFTHPKTDLIVQNYKQLSWSSEKCDLVYNWEERSSPPGLEWERADCSRRLRSSPGHLPGGWWCEAVSSYNSALYYVVLHYWHFKLKVEMWFAIARITAMRVEHLPTSLSLQKLSFIKFQYTRPVNIHNKTSILNIFSPLSLYNYYRISLHQPQTLNWILTSF